MVAEAASDGGSDAAEPFVWEWRGALFAVRLARLRIDNRVPVQAPPDPDLRHLGHRFAPSPAVLLAAIGALVLVVLAGLTLAH